LIEPTETNRSGAPTAAAVSTEIHLGTEKRFADVTTILAPRKSTTPACWCLTYRLTNELGAAGLRRRAGR
jgi:hypothetical protein